MNKVQKRVSDSDSSSLAGKAHKAISDMIRKRHLKGGEVVVESRLAESLKLSRTPLREALQRLEGEGLVVRSTGRSLAVRRVELKEYLQSLKVREILEPEAGVLSCGKIRADLFDEVDVEIRTLQKMKPYDVEAHWQSDANLHDLFINRCGNDVLISLLQQMRTTTHLFEIAQLSDRLGSDSTEHLAILDALRREDKKDTRRTINAHIRSLYKFAIENLI